MKIAFFFFSVSYSVCIACMSGIATVWILGTGYVFVGSGSLPLTRLPFCHSNHTHNCGRIALGGDNVRWCLHQLRAAHPHRSCLTACPWVGLYSTEPAESEQPQGHLCSTLLSPVSSLAPSSKASADCAATQRTGAQGCSNQAYGSAFSRMADLLTDRMVPYAML